MNVIKEIIGKKLILVVEDDLALSKALSDKLNLNHFEVKNAKDGEEGLEMANKFNPNLIILDLNMPKVTGIQMLESLRAGENEWSHTVPVIILTNMDTADEKTVTALNTLEPSYYLIKANTSLDEVITKVKTLLRIED